MNPTVISTRGLSKRFADVVAADNVELKVDRGEIYGFLGLNGAGKSTTIRLLLGMLKPTAGWAELFGERIGPGTTALWRRVGHMVEAPTAYGELTVRQNLEVARRMQGIGDPRAADRVLEKMGLAPHRNRRAKVLSQGNLQRLGLARALLSDPELLVLDEPANGLDPAGVVEIRELLRRLARESGTTVFMSSHILAEVDRLATRIGIIHRGRLVEELEADELERRRQHRLEVETRDLEAAERALRAAGFTGVARAREGQKTWLEVRDARALEHPEEAARILAAADLPPTRLVKVQEDLEQYFLNRTRELDEVKS